MTAEHKRRARIAARFNAAADYDASANVQQRCALSLMDRIAAAHQTTTPRRILEIGCGTGFLTQHLAAQFPAADLLATDLAPAMVERARGRLTGTQIHFSVMDGEYPDIDGPFDLIASSLCIQWFSNRRAGLRRLCDLLAPGGRLMFATLLQGSLKEWRQACETVDVPCGVPDYPDLNAVHDDWPSTGTGAWDAIDLHDPVANAQTFLRGLRAIGASVPREGTASASPTELRRAMRRFDTLEGNTARGVTYRIGFGTFIRTPITLSPPKGLHP